MARSPLATFSPYDARDAEIRFDEMAARGNAIRLDCWGCDRLDQISGDDLVARFGAARTIADLGGRMKCKACGSLKVSLYWVNGQSQPGVKRWHSTP